MDLGGGKGSYMLYAGFEVGSRDSMCLVLAYYTGYKIVVTSVFEDFGGEVVVCSEIVVGVMRAG